MPYNQNERSPHLYMLIETQLVGWKQQLEIPLPQKESENITTDNEFVFHIIVLARVQIGI